jgi:integrase
MISDTAVAQELRQFYETELENDRINRLKLRSPFVGKMNVLVRREEVSEIVEDLNRGEIRWVRDEAERLCERLGLLFSLDDQRCLEICQHLMRVRLEAARRQCERDQGRWDGVPFDPLLSSADVRAVGEQPNHAGGKLENLGNVEPVSGLIDRFLREKEGLGDSAIEKYRVMARLFDEFTGGKAVRAIARADCVGFKDMLLQLPTNWTKRFPGKTAQEAIATNSISAEKLQTLAVGTINDSYLTYLKTFFAWANSNDLVPGNPAIDVRVATAKSHRHRTKREPFTSDKLRQLFNAPVFTGCASLGRPYDRGSLLIRDQRFWAPLLALFSGARANELGQLETTDVKQKAGVWGFEITTQTDDDELRDEKRVKTSAGRRFVPIHPELERLGFLQYVEERRVAKCKRVFPDWKMGKDGTYSSIFGKFFNSQLLKKVGIKNPRLCFHSFRHNFVDALRDAGIPDAVKKALIGHSDPSVTALYGSGEPIQQLANAMSRLRYEGLDLNHLYPLATPATGGQSFQHIGASAPAQMIAYNS